MRRPWQIWVWFTICLIMVVPALLWLTHRALLLERAEAVAQQQADREEEVGSALWQLDAELTQLIAPEIARPAVFFQPFYRMPGKGPTQPVPSPLLVQPAAHVLLHFQLYPDETWRSPQCPTGQQYELAVAHGVSAENIRLSQERMQQLARAVRYSTLVEKLPCQTLPAPNGTHVAWGSNIAFLSQGAQAKLLMNVLDLQQVQQQLANSQNPANVDPEQNDAPLGQMASPYNLRRNQTVQSRQGSELQSRNALVQGVAQQALRDQRGNYANAELVPTEELITEGISQPLWLDGQLVLARRVVGSGQTLVQGTWLDWPQIKTQLLAKIAATLPGAELVPVTNPEAAHVGRLLAALPVQLQVPPVDVLLNPASPIRISLLLAWVFLTLATVAVGVLLRGVVTLSERRAAFVSAVTHELRTPLTTFRMYAEMLAAGMVSEPHQRATYLQTLQVEADRLSHLVENVLQYSRLERGAGPKRREEVTLDALLQRVAPRLADRATQADMHLDTTAAPEATAVQLTTDPAAVEQILLNLVDNACKYAAGATDRRIHLRVEATPRQVLLRVQDHGPGISAAEAKRLFRPFSKSAQQAAVSAPGVGLGLALSRRLAAELGGRLELDQADASGATFVCTLPR